jgi:hypothetical protein
VRPCSPVSAGVVAPALSVAENPTTSITPIEGEEFTKRLLTPFQENKLMIRKSNVAATLETPVK